MRVLLTGVQKSGKTTLISHYEKRYPSVEVIHEVAREIISQDPSIVSNPYLQDMLFSNQVRKEKSVAAMIYSPFSSTKVAILDRSVIDNIVYTKLLATKFPKKDFKIKSSWEEYIDNAPYEKVFLCNPNDIKYESSMSMYWKEDGENVRLKLHDLYLEVLEYYNFEYEILSGSIEARIGVIDDFLESVFRPTFLGRIYSNSAFVV